MSHLIAINVTTFHHFSKPAMAEQYVLKYKCDAADCDLCFGRQRQLEFHKFKTHGIDSPEVTSCKCGKKFFGKNALEKHESMFCTLNGKRKCLDPEKGLQQFKLAMYMCEECISNTQRSRWSITTDGQSLYRTLFLCMDCATVNEVVTKPKGKQ
jgi:hypothetical protein